MRYVVYVHCVCRVVVKMLRSDFVCWIKVLFDRHTEHASSIGFIRCYWSCVDWQERALATYKNTCFALWTHPNEPNFIYVRHMKAPASIATEHAQWHCSLVHEVATAATANRRNNHIKGFAEVRNRSRSYFSAPFSSAQRNRYWFTGLLNFFGSNEHFIGCNPMTDWEQYSPKIWVELDYDNDVMNSSRILSHICQ